MLQSAMHTPKSESYVQYADQLCHVQLETAATAGVVVVLAVIGIVMYEAISAGLPGLASGDVPIWSLKVREGRDKLTCAD